MCVCVCVKGEERLHMSSVYVCVYLCLSVCVSERRVF